ncbi:MAG: hypothetical protein M3Y24_12565 [Acidobacteriota bacterium]|nr:hypothetical protein [Acidobacteriota bacterium]
MTPFEDELKKALPRRQPSDTFARSILGRVAQRDGRRELKRPPFGWWSPAYWRPLVALALMLIFASTFAYREHLHRLQGQAAKRQLLLAMRIAGAELHEAKLRVKRVEFPEVVMR